MFSEDEWSSAVCVTEARLVQTRPHQLGAFYVGSPCLRTCSSLKCFSLDTRFTLVSHKHRLPSGRRCQLVYLMMRHDITCLWSCFQKLMFIYETHLSVSHAGKCVLEAQLRWILIFFFVPDTAKRMNFSSLQFFLVCLVLKHISALKKCDTIDRCTCLTDEGKISLWELARRNGVPR